MSDTMKKGKDDTTLVKSSIHRKWQHKEEVFLIDFIKRNREFEKPCARIYYTRFLSENRLDINWKLVRCKVRNMRTAYRKVKLQQIKKMESTNCNAEVVRRQILKACWYVDEFDVLFPNDMDYHANDNAYPIFVDEESTRCSFSITATEDTTPQNHLCRIKNEKQDLDCDKEKLQLNTIESQVTAKRNRLNPIKKWTYNEEISIIGYLKQNRDFEKPTGQLYYTRFISETGMNIGWKQVRSKVRNMRILYRKAKEYESKNEELFNYNPEVLRNQILKICWYVDDFDMLFPDEMDYFICKSYEQNLHESENNVDNSNEAFTSNILHDEDATTISSSCNSTNRDVSTVQNNLCSLKRKKSHVDSSIKEQELDLAREKLKFEREKFRQEIRLKEKEIEIEEKLKVMEFQMKERIAIKELEIAELRALRSIENSESTGID